MFWGHEVASSRLATPTKERKKPNNRSKDKKCKKCGCIITNNTKLGICRSCYKIYSRKVLRPSYDALIKDIKETNYVQTGKKYGVSNTTIKKWIKIYENNILNN